MKSSKRLLALPVILFLLAVSTHILGQDTPTPEPPTETLIPTDVPPPTPEPPTLTPIPSDTPTDLPTATIAPSYTPSATVTASLTTTYTDTATSTETATPTPTGTMNQTATPTWTATPTDSPFDDEIPPVAAFGVMAAAYNPNFALVAAGDVDALYAAVDAVNAGLISTIYLNADGQPNDPPAQRTYILGERLRFDQYVVIHGNGAILQQTPVVEAPFFPRVLYVPPGVSVEISHVTFTGADLNIYNSRSRYGAGIRNDGALHIVDSVIYANDAVEGGGGIFNIGSLWLERTKISTNSAGGGGGIQNDGGGDIVASCMSIVNNTANYGSGILNGNGDNLASRITIHHSIFDDNHYWTAVGKGADIFNLLPGSVMIDASENFWGYDGVAEVDDDQGGLSILTSPILSEDPTRPNASGGYTYPECQPAAPATIPPVCELVGPFCSSIFQPTPSPTPAPPQLGLTLQLDPSVQVPQDENGAFVFHVGDQIPLIAQVTSADGRDIPDTVRIQLTLPRGLVPQGMTIADVDDTPFLTQLLRMLADLLAVVNPDLSALANDFLGISLSDTEMTFTYDYAGGLIAGQTFPITLEVMGQIPRRYEVQGTASIVQPSSAAMSPQAETFALSALEASPFASTTALVALQVFPEYDPGTECLTQLIDWNSNFDRRVLTVSEIARVSNGDLSEQQISTRPQLTANMYVVVVAMHLNQQFVQVRYVDASGDTVSGDSWVRVRDLGTSLTFSGMMPMEATEGSHPCRVADGSVSDDQIRGLLIEESDLPLCEAGQFVDCGPAIACHWIFGCNPDGSQLHEALVLHQFGSTTGGCSNANVLCSPKPCRLWVGRTEFDNMHCGTDLQTTETDGRQTGPVYAVRSGVFCYYDRDAGGVFSIRSIDGNEIWQYQYVHIIPPSAASADHVKPYSYVASGVYLGNYGQVGNTESTNLHVHLANIVHPNVSSNLICAITTITQPSTEHPTDPYRPIELPGIEG